MTVPDEHTDSPQTSQPEPSEPAESHVSSDQEVVVAGSPGSGQEYPIRWTERLALKDLGDLEAELEKPVEIPHGLGPEHVLVLTGPGGRRVTVRTGREYVSYIQSGYYPRTTYDITMASWFISVCEPPLFLKRASPARISYLADFAWDQEPLSNLPPMLGPDRQENYVAGIAKGKTWVDFFPDTVVEEVGRTKIRLVTTGTRIRFEVVAWADFNGDGIEDILLWTSRYAVGGTLRRYCHVVVTRLGEGDRLKEVRLPIYRNSGDADRLRRAEKRAIGDD